MNDLQKAFGHEVMDFLNGEPAFEVIERDDGVVMLSGGPENYFATFRRWPAPNAAPCDSFAGEYLTWAAERGGSLCTSRSADTRFWAWTSLRWRLRRAGGEEHATHRRCPCIKCPRNSGCSTRFS